VTTYDTWNGSWGTSWALSWTRNSTPVVRDTHDGWIPDHIIQRFYENERLKHTKVIKAYKKAVEIAPLEVQDIVNEFVQNPSKITKNQLNEIAEDKAAISKLLLLLDSIEQRLMRYKLDQEDDNLLIMLAAIV